MGIKTSVGIGGLAVLAAVLATHRSPTSPPDLARVLDLPREPVRLVFFQPADCELRRRAIVREIAYLHAVPVVLYADAVASADLGRLLGEEVSGVEVLRLPDVGLETTFREHGVRATPFVLTLDEDGAVVDVVLDVGGA